MGASDQVSDNCVSDLGYEEEDSSVTYIYISTHTFHLRNSVLTTVQCSSSFAGCIIIFFQMSAKVDNPCLSIITKHIWELIDASFCQ